MYSAAHSSVSCLKSTVRLRRACACAAAISTVFGVNPQGGVLPAKLGADADMVVVTGAD
jgi:hypothetical protein